MQLSGNSLRVYPTLVLLGVLAATSAIPTTDRTSEQGEATIDDPTLECTSYNYEPVTDAMSSFPPIWESASILSSDSAALARWNSISDSIPTDIDVKSIPPPDNYSASDPDCWWTVDQCVTPKLGGLPLDIVAAPEPSTLGYGFDDGPNCSHNAFYDYLESQNQKATFYFIGSNVAQWPLEAQRALADGHEICAHTWSHPYMTTFTSEDAFAEIWYSLQMIKLVVGVTPTCWRPPYGDVDDRIRAIANAMGLTTIMWEYDSEDANVGVSGVTDDTVIDNYNDFIQIAGNGTFASAGTIILTHEIDNFSMTEAIAFYPQLKNVFQHIVPVGVALNKTQPYLETNYSLPTFAQYIAGTLTVTSNTTNITSSALPSSTHSTSTSVASPSASKGSSGKTSTTPNNAHKAVDFEYGRLLSFVLVVTFSCMFGSWDL